ncbi:ATP-binding protein [Paenibacillus sp. PDC88]|uniref:ATP-binding protein n=1 Tax=Paenibacillus sp. PDC88 TaxID=1884375 RepID=UPI00089B6EF4|nr:ATP-binding protein [Paenibacillus sp. PDC88]SDX17708.1 Signal transduction histidine kinase, nitrogen specific [Paenibacillus sp. PDC88]
MFAVKNILLQILLAGITPLLFSLFIGRMRSHFHDLNSSHRSKTAERHLLLACIISMVLCVIFSTTLFDSLYLNLDTLAVTVAILYGSTSAGLFVSIFSTLLFVTTTDLWNDPLIFLQSGILLYPIMLLLAKRFKQDRIQGKRKLFLVPFALFAMISMAAAYASYFAKADSVHIDFILYSLVYSVLSVVTGLAIIQFIELQFVQQALASEIEAKRRQFIHHSNLNKQLLNTIPVSVVAFDVDGRIVNMNERMLDELRRRNPGMDHESDMIGKRIESIVGQEHGSRVTERIRVASKSGEISSEYLNVGPYIFHTLISPVRDPYEGSLIGSSLVLQDITELEKLRSELAHVERLSLVGQMAASITHEVRNPMAVVRGFLQLMHERSPRSLDHYYRIVMEELDRANGIITDFLSLAQNRIVEKEEVHLHDIIHDMLPLLKADANMRGQTVKLNLSDRIPRYHLNSKEMKQLILNLARNGMEAMDSKGTLYIETSCEQNRILLKVIDEGPGIPPAVQEKLFEPFYTTKSKGTGLGLALCRGIAERHNAVIQVESGDGRGTMFTVVFKL